jgi:putative hemin transport protein
MNAQSPLNKMPEKTPAQLAAAWAQLREAEPKLRIRDAAAKLGASEAELLATRVPDGVIRLRQGSWKEIIGAAGALGEVMALTRNEHCVHERHGLYGELSGNGHVGLIVGEDIDLRIFFAPWRHGFAVTEQASDKPRHSLQFFDAQGAAVHKIYAADKTDMAAWQELVARFTADKQDPEVKIEAAPAKPVLKADAEIDTAKLRAEWAALKDTHDFFPLLRRHKTAREQAFRLAGSDFAVRVDNGATRRMLRVVAEINLPIMVFTGNQGMIQIHSGPVKRLVATGPWFNVLDPKFNLHLRDTAVVSSWVVRKPTEDGVVTSLELFDAEGELIVSFFGKRKPGIPELPRWRDLVESLVAPLAA